MKKLLFLLSLFCCSMAHAQMSTLDSAKAYIDSVIVNNQQQKVTPLKLNVGLNKIINGIKNQSPCNGLVSGGQVTHTTGTTFSVVASSFNIHCTTYNTALSTVTLAAAGDTQRVDLIYGKLNGTVDKRTGTESLYGAQPNYDPENEFPLAWVTVSDTGVSIGTSTSSGLWTNLGAGDITPIDGSKRVVINNYLLVGSGYSLKTTSSATLAFEQLWENTGTGGANSVWGIGMGTDSSWQLWDLRVPRMVMKFDKNGIPFFSQISRSSGAQYKMPIYDTISKKFSYTDIPTGGAGSQDLNTTLGIGNTTTLPIFINSGKILFDDAANTTYIHGGLSNTGTTRNVFVGRLAGNANSGSDVTAIGYGAATVNTSDGTTALGTQAASGATGNMFTGIGYRAGINNTGNDFTGIGRIAGGNANAFDHVIAIGTNAVASAHRQAVFSDSINAIKASGITSAAGNVLTDVDGDGVFTSQPPSGSSGGDIQTTLDAGNISRGTSLLMRNAMVQTTDTTTGLTTSISGTGINYEHGAIISLAPVPDVVDDQQIWIPDSPSGNDTLALVSALRDSIQRIWDSLHAAKQIIVDSSLKIRTGTTKDTLGLPYKLYVARWDKISGANAPTDRLFENTIGPYTITYVDAGQYRIEFTGTSFETDQLWYHITYIPDADPSIADPALGIEPDIPNAIRVNQNDNDAFSNAMIEIRIYPPAP